MVENGNITVISMESAANGPVKVHSFKVFELPLSSVTVFNDRAEVKRIVKVDLEAGINEVIVEAVSQSANPDSIRVDGRGEAVIHEVQFQCKPALPSEVNSPKVKKVEEERKELVEKKSVVEDRQRVVQKQIEALDELVAKVSGAVVNPVKKDTAYNLDETTFENITKLMEFYELNSVKVRTQSREIAAELKKLEEEIAKLDAELDRMRNDINNSRNISILVESEKKTLAVLIVSYQVWGANWVPTYDIRVSYSEDGKGIMKVSYYGKIQQSSGEDWNEAKLILSTAQPSLGGNLPTLGTMEAKFRRPEPPVYRTNEGYSAGGVMSLSKSRSSRSGFGGAPMYAPTSPSAAPMVAACMAVSNVSAGDTVMSTVFEITRPTTIPSDSSEHRVTIALVDLHPAMVHVTVPCRDTNVYLMASLINESAYPFLAGQAAVYFENSFVAKTQLKSVSPGESFMCSLGVDPAVKVEYKPVHKYTEQVGLISKNPCVAHEQKIVLKNTKKEEVLITVKDHIPKSTDEKIKIRVLSPQLPPVANADNGPQKPTQVPVPGVKLNKQNNLEWTLKLEPNKEAELLIKYAMEHPSSETVVFEEAF